jgi:hypothetical protein
VGAPDCEKAELQHIYLLMKINGLKLAQWLFLGMWRTWNSSKRQSFFEPVFCASK